MCIRGLSRNVLFLNLQIFKLFLFYIFFKILFFESLLNFSKNILKYNFGFHNQLKNWINLNFNYCKL